jgi:hypothetical protein
MAPTSVTCVRMLSRNEKSPCFVPIHTMSSLTASAWIGTPNSFTMRQPLSFSPTTSKPASVPAQTTPSRLAAANAVTLLRSTSVCGPVSDIAATNDCQCPSKRLTPFAVPTQITSFWASTAYTSFDANPSDWRKTTHWRSGVDCAETGETHRNRSANATGRTRCKCARQRITLWDNEWQQRCSDERCIAWLLNHPTINAKPSAQSMGCRHESTVNSCLFLALIPGAKSSRCGMQQGLTTPVE